MFGKRQRPGDDFGAAAGAGAGVGAGVDDASAMQDLWASEVLRSLFSDAFQESLGTTKPWNALLHVIDRLETKKRAINDLILTASTGRKQLLKQLEGEEEILQGLEERFEKQPENDQAKQRMLNKQSQVDALRHRLQTPLFFNGDLLADGAARGGRSRGGRSRSARHRRSGRARRALSRRSRGGRIL